MLTVLYLPFVLQTTRLILLPNEFQMDILRINR
jgi:hypothetical protein